MDGKPVVKVHAYYQGNYFSQAYVGHHFGCGLEMEVPLGEEFKAHEKLQAAAEALVNLAMENHKTAARKIGDKA